VRNRRCVGGEPKQATATARANQMIVDVCCATEHTSRPAASVGLSIQRLMSRSINILQMNVQKQRSVQQSMINDESLKEYAALVVSEPYAFEVDGEFTTSLIGHQS
jgi:hypothetical protein